MYTHDCNAARVLAFLFQTEWRRVYDAARTWFMENWDKWQEIDNRLKDISFIVIKTYKTDLYGRFIADVFYHPTLKDKEDVAEDGFFLNQEILEAGLAKIYQ